MAFLVNNYSLCWWCQSVVLSGGKMHGQSVGKILLSQHYADYNIIMILHVMVSCL